MQFISNSWCISLPVLFYIHELPLRTQFFNTMMKFFMYNILVYWWKAISYDFSGRVYGFKFQI
jgi:hypothetical protein